MPRIYIVYRGLAVELATYDIEVAYKRACKLNKKFVSDKQDGECEDLYWLSRDSTFWELKLKNMITLIRKSDEVAFEVDWFEFDEKREFAYISFGCFTPHICGSPISTRASEELASKDGFNKMLDSLSNTDEIFTLKAGCFISLHKQMTKYMETCTVRHRYVAFVIKQPIE